MEQQNPTSSGCVLPCDRQSLPDRRRRTTPVALRYSAMSPTSRFHRYEKRATQSDTRHRGKIPNAPTAITPKPSPTYRCGEHLSALPLSPKRNKSSDRHHSYLVALEARMSRRVAIAMALSHQPMLHNPQSKSEAQVHSPLLHGRTRANVRGRSTDRFRSD